MSMYHIFLTLTLMAKIKPASMKFLILRLNCLLWSRAGLNQIRKRELQAAFLLWNYKGFKSAPAHI